mmetsp:Transcript_13632/g.17957  ORF Transcript_13632/g.17957 Transcript_13632/m.17957 type:complete len:348 (+) Transcript_13632:113-1156(+)|eukprot:CAMPEP_0117755336 /NCGR_PEP_ID=MMETSP0947-20121206/13390_1 /TAXON_ID=44440 /ORGANISM="Chattonella subsalsa, Strain CCMP2191" /LENGTH=347 /DNA_ID=CAMNT_0005574649 /DNA_START=175 /DNA_END=1218 /DNA_ORIENTATION=+
MKGEDAHSVQLGSGNLGEATMPGLDFSLPTDLGVANELKLLSEQEIRLQRFWNNQIVEIGGIDPEKEDFKNLELPLARIKKIMRLEEEIQSEIGGFRFMISAEAPVLLSRAAALFTGELTIRASTHTEESKRRTLQRQDIAMAMTKSDMYDFLIDIVPREEARTAVAKTKMEGGGDGMDPNQMMQMQQQAMQAMMPGVMPSMMGGMGMDQMMQQQQMMMAAMAQMQNPQMQMMMQQAQAAAMQQQMMLGMGGMGNQGNEDGDDDEDDDDENNEDGPKMNDPQQMMQKMMQQMMQGNTGEGGAMSVPSQEQMQQMMQQMMPMMQMAMMAMQQVQDNSSGNAGQQDEEA